MPTIGVAVSAETKEKFDSIARQRCMTTSRLAASLIHDLLAKERGEHPRSSGDDPQLGELTRARGGAKTEQVFVRFEPYYFAELGRLARERDWYRGTYLANLFHAHADRRPVLCQTEISAVRQATRQLADIGRNINQIARKLNVSVDHAHLAMTVDFEMVRVLVELEVNAMKDLMRANLSGWGTNNA